MESKGLKTRALVSLFIAGVLAIHSGCTRTTTTGATNECWDDNEDGYCDDDGSRAGGYYMSNGRKRYTKTESGLTSGTANKPPSGISSGTQGSKSGIGSSSSASSSSSGG